MLNDYSGTLQMEHHEKS